MRLGFVVKPLARPELKSHDSRRWQNSPHLSVSLAYLRDVFGYLASTGITMYRMSSDLAPYATLAATPQYHNQVSECAAELAQLGAQARGAGLRLSFHAIAATAINSPDPEVAANATAGLNVLASILDGMEAGPDAVVVTHVGGVYGSPAAALERCAHAIDALSGPTRSRLVLENDDGRFGVEDVLWVHQRTGVPVVFDRLHHRLRGWETMSECDALSACLATWPAGVLPKIHWSTPRTDWLVTERSADETPKVTRSRWMYHADYVNPFDFIDFMRSAAALRPFDVMLEVRAKDLALIQLRRDLVRYAPDVAARFEAVSAP
jgi:UV DNA damage endonuclease